MLAVHLVQQSPVPVRILLFDRAAAFGSGVAYSTPNDRHLLNVRIGNMSAYDPRPDHFIKWLEGCAKAAGAEPHGPFVSRGLYGQYLRSTLSAGLAAHPASSMIGIDDEVVSLTAAAKSVELGATGVSVTAKARGDRAVHRIEGTWLVNCSGPQLDYDRISDPLIRSLFDAGLARPDSLSLGLDVGDDYRLVSRSGVPTDVLFALGPPIRGNLWETTAVPDIRKQCEAVARHLTSMSL